VRTPSQTVGPFFAICLTRWTAGPAAFPDGIEVGGYVLDGAGEPVPDALIETWQTEPERAFARSGTDDEGHWAVTTRKAPFIDVSVFARGLLNRVVTRIYFADQPELNAADPVLADVPADRRDTLLARPDGGGYRFDVILQGEGETVFFAI
jgi:protocatechuate 3,4-dioxygenase alpha subunit